MRRRNKNSFQVGLAPLARSATFARRVTEMAVDGGGDLCARPPSAGVNVTQHLRRSASSSAASSSVIETVTTLRRVQPSDVDGDSSRMTDNVDKFL